MAKSQNGSEETLDQEQLQQKGQNQQEDGGKRGQEDQKGGSVGFWNRELKAVRLEVFRKWAVTSTCPEVKLTTASLNTLNSMYGAED
jgi:hypothetical protein